MGRSASSSASVAGDLLGELGELLLGGGDLIILRDAYLRELCHLEARLAQRALEALLLSLARRQQRRLLEREAGESIG